MSTPSPRAPYFFAAVTGIRPSPQPKIDDEVVLLDVGQGQHPVDDFLRRRDIGRQLRRIGPLGAWCAEVPEVPGCRGLKLSREAKRDKPATSLIMFVSIQNPV